MAAGCWICPVSSSYIVPIEAGAAHLVGEEVFR